MPDPNGTSEKQPHSPTTPKSVQLHEHKDEQGYLVAVDSSDSNAAVPDGEAKFAADGHTVLIPQPSSDPRDPLNWSWARKHLVLFVLSFGAFLADYGGASGAVTLLAQAEEWDMTPDGVNASQAGNVFMLGAGGVIAAMLSAYFGRLPVIFWFLTISLGTAAWCAGATTFESFMAARILDGFFHTVCQVVGLMLIQDVFYFHERARKINIWASFFVVSPYMGPLITAFMMETQHWSLTFWVYTGMSALGLILVIVFLPETYYDRSIPEAEQPSLGNRATALIGIPQWRSRHLRNTFPQAVWRVASVLLKPTILIANIYYLLTFAWAVGINTTLAIFVEPLYGFGFKQIGYFYFTPIIAVILGELVGHWLHDSIARQYIRAHNGRFEPEVRLRAVFFSTPFMVAGLVLVGHALEREWHYMATAVAWGCYVFGIMVTTVALSSYCLDSYPEASGEVSAWLNNSRTLGGFVVSYLQVRWAASEGTVMSFGVQAAVCGGAVLLVVVLIVWGKRMRVWSGPLNFATA